MSRLPVLLAIAMFASASILADPLSTRAQAVGPRPIAAPAQVSVTQAATLGGIQAETQRRVAEMSRGLAATPEGPERRALLGRIVEVKRQGRTALLNAQLQFARERGDAARVAEVGAALQQMVSPRPLPASTIGASAKKAPEVPHAR